MDRNELLDRYQFLGNEPDFVAAKALFEQAEPDPETLLNHGYLLECHARNLLRRAVELYEQAIALDPGFDKPHYQLITAKTALFDTGDLIDAYRERLVAAPTSVREHRFLGAALLRAHDYEGARAVIDAGLDLAPDDPALFAQRGEAKAGTGDAEGALADWRGAVELDPEDIGGLFGTAFLLEREGRLEEAAAAWEEILAWIDARRPELEGRWPRQELERVRRAAAS